MGSVALAAGIALAASAGYAQRHRAPSRARGHRGTAPTATGGGGGGGTGASQVITIQVGEVATMMQRQRVYLFTAPPGNGAYAIGTLGEGRRVWALLPSCRRPNPDDPRDPCPVGRVTMEAVGGDGRINATEPQPIGSTPDGRRVQSFVVPAGVQQLRIQIHRPNQAVRYEAAVEAADLVNLPAPDGRPRGPGEFEFNLQRYPAL